MNTVSTRSCRSRLTALVAVFLVLFASATGQTARTTGSIVHGAAVLVATGRSTAIRTSSSAPRGVDRSAAASSRQLASGHQTTAHACRWTEAVGNNNQDLSAHYWYTMIDATTSVSFTISATFPASRYTSIYVYSNTATVDSLYDVEHPADPGSTNPFATAGKRGTGTYTLRLTVGPRPAEPASGTLYADVPPNTTLALLYRIYLPDDVQPVITDTSPITQGWVPLPTMVAYDSATGLPIDCPVFTTPPIQPPRPPFTPVGAYFRWPVVAYPNDDVAYLKTDIFDTMDLSVTRFKPPMTPQTRDGHPLDATTQLRYWSACVDYKVSDQPFSCTPDELSPPVGPDGKITLVVAPDGSSPPAGLPPSIMWISPEQPISYSILIRNMLPHSSFTQSAFAVPFEQMAAPFMGAYAPTLALCTVAHLQASGDGCGSNAAIVVSSANGLYGQTATVTGTGFGPGNVVTMTWDSSTATPLATATAAATGSFVATFQVPQAVAGNHTVIALDSASGKFASTPFVVTPRLVLQPSSGPAGTVVHVLGLGFGSSETVKLIWDRAGQVLGTTNSNSAGSFIGSQAATITIPATAGSGSHIVYGVGLASRATGSSAFTVQSPNTTASAPG